MVDFDPPTGSEINKIRPAVVVSVPEVGRLPLRMVVPLTDWKARYSDHIWLTLVAPTPENGLMKDSAADAFQLKSLALERFRRKIGALTAAQMADITAAIALCVGYP